MFTEEFAKRLEACLKACKAYEYNDCISIIKFINVNAYVKIRFFNKSRLKKLRKWAKIA